MKRVLFVLVLLVLLPTQNWGAGADTLYPNANGAYQIWTPKSGGNHYVEVDDPVSSPDTGTYVYLNNKSLSSETQALDDFAYPDSTIDSVRIQQRIKKAGTGSITASFLWYDGTTRIDGGAITLTTSYVDKFETRTTNLTGQPWTASDVNNLQVGIVGTAAASSRYIFDTQIFLYVFFHGTAGGQNRNRSRVIQRLLSLENKNYYPEDHK